MNESVTVRDAPVTQDALRYVLVPTEALRLALPGYGRVRVGRSELNDVVLRAAGIEEEHIHLHVDDYGIELEALAKGVVVKKADGKRVLAAGDTVEVTDGDKIAIGDTVLIFSTAVPIEERGRVWASEALDADLDDLDDNGRTALLCVASMSKDSGALEDALIDLLDQGPTTYRLDDARFAVLWRGVSSGDAQRLSSRVASELEAKGLFVATGLAHTSETEVDRLVTAATQRAAARPSADDEAMFIGEHLADVVALVDRVASTRSPVLILGETGTGKNLLARMIHDRSDRRTGPFVVANSSELDPGDEQLGSLLPRATGGTLVLDEVSALPARAQLGLGRFLEQLDADPSAPDVRIVATTNRNLDVDEETSSFRLDLLFRLNRVSVRLPALRDRAADVLPLANWLLARLSAVTGRTPPALDERAAQALERYRWPGNIRQMENALERALFICDGDTLEPRHLPSEVREGKTREATSSRPAMTLKEEVAELEKRRIMEALDEHPSQAAAARALGMPLRTFVTRMDAFDIPRARSSKDD